MSGECHVVSEEASERMFTVTYSHCMGEHVRYCGGTQAAQPFRGFNCAAPQCKLDVVGPMGTLREALPKLCAQFLNHIHAQSYTCTICTACVLGAAGTKPCLSCWGYLESVQATVLRDGGNFVLDDDSVCAGVGGCRMLGACGLAEAPVFWEMGGGFDVLVGLRHTSIHHTLAC